MYQHETIGSHREPFTVERYYDTKGKLRSVFVDYRNTNIRVYLDRGGRVFWGIEKNCSKIRRYDTNNDYWETKPNSAIGAMKEFQEEQLCPEITK